MPEGTLVEQLAQSRHYFNSGVTRPYAFRIKQLQKLKKALGKYEEALHQALYTDLRKSPEESWVTETGFVLTEIRLALRRLKRWMEPEKVRTNLLNFPSTSFVLREPLGVVLIIGAWNYPLQLLMAPLVGAIAAGNCVVLKPSEHAPATAAIIKQLIREFFPDPYILLVEGEGAAVVPAMMNHFRFDHIFYTGNAAVGKLVYGMAAAQLAPVTLELGGKSPCIVDESANIRVAARRIAVTKFSNAGQMCIAPDYVLVHASKKEALVKALQQTIRDFYSENPSTHYNYGKIINEKQFDRLAGYLQQATILHGGRHNREQLYMEPTLVDNIPTDAPLMQEEIFGPILPVLSFQTMQEAKTLILQHPDPLALYVFTANGRREKEWVTGIPFGGGCVNNTSWQATNPYLPFGGRGYSGVGAYHGHNSFETFSHHKPILKTPVWFDPSIKYPPFKGKLGLFRWFVR